MLTVPELITLIQAHNKLVSIKVRRSMSRETLIKLIEGKGYKVDHKNKKIVDARKDRPRRPKITLKEAQDMLPKPKTALQKQKAEERKEEKAAEEKKKLRMAKKEAVEQSKKGTKKVPKGSHKMPDGSIMKDKDMGDTAYIKQQKKLQLEKQKETRRALLKQNVKVDKTTRRGKKVVGAKGDDKLKRDIPKETPVAYEKRIFKLAGVEHSSEVKKKIDAIWKLGSGKKPTKKQRDEIQELLKAYKLSLKPYLTTNELNQIGTSITTTDYNSISDMGRRNREATEAMVKKLKSSS